MTQTVTAKRAFFYPAGTPRAVGDSFSMSDADATSYVGQGLVVYATTPDNPSFRQPIVGTPAQQAAFEGMVSGYGKLPALMRAVAANNPIDAAVSTATVTDALSASDLAVAYQVRAALAAGLARLGGGVLVGSNANNAETKAASIQTASNVGVSGAYQTAPYLEINAAGASSARLRFYVGGGSYTPKYRVRVNNRYISKTMTDWGGVGAQRTLTVDLSAFAANVVNAVRWEWDGPAVAQTVSIDAGSMWATVAEPNEAFILADSFEAYGSNRSPHSCVLAQIAIRAGLEPFLSAVGGTGYINDGSGNYPATATARLDDALLRPFKVAMVALGTNDHGAASAAALTSAALSTLRGLRSRLPAPIPFVVFGNWNSTAGGSTLTQTQCEQAVSDAVTAFADSYTTAIPICTDSLGAWVSASNSATYISDGTHFNAAGETYGGMRAMVLPRLAALSL